MPELGLITVRAAWELLSIPTGVKINAFPLEIESGLDVRVAIDSTGARHLLVESPEESLFTGSGSHLFESVTNIVFAGKSRTYLDISVADSRLMPEFDSLIVDVLTEGDTVSAANVHAALERWRALFRLIALRMMSSEQILGLAGELFILNLLLQNRHDSLSAWTGPFGTHHDFEIDGACVEVKSATASSRGVTVHGLRQLEADRSVPLLLVVCLFEEVVGGPTISDRIAGIRRLTADELALDGALRRSGWSETSAPGPHLELVEAFTVRVGDETPRLLPAESGGVSKGIVSADYEVDIDLLRSIAEPLSIETIIEKFSS
ncbi:PD-(D/E)XK motif protein [Herbiconiux daphne]|uniref:PD-(D/E)XK motif protein n=1 Tax=Herbiconiux daphne TaxID=2970914 RepID=A0ABT2H1G5_9MICO|nr:PD-(D/E)XK motif protein [Herbiconiux daphne]MCS5733778.1 PD-(D/E)XK motif protein [Herbiconiux daphne]